MRNFLYNKSDILIAVIIIAVAAIIIWTRIGAIMDSSGDTGKETPPSSSAQEADTPPADVAEGVTGAATEGETPPAVTDPAAEGVTTPAAADGADGTEDADADAVVKFKIELGASSGSVAADLEEAGIISADDFIKEIQAQGKEGSIKVGTFKLKPSMSAAKIVEKVTN